MVFSIPCNEGSGIVIEEGEVSSELLGGRGREVKGSHELLVYHTWGAGSSRMVAGSAMKMM